MTEDLNSLMHNVDDPTAKVAEKLGRLKKDFKTAKGRGTLTEGRDFTKPDVLPTGIPELDNQILGIGGLAKGRVIELAGDTNAGKSTLAWNIAREAIQEGLSVCVAENEGTFTHEYAEAIGMHPDAYHLFKGYSLSGPEFLEEVQRLAEIGYDMIIVDSLFGIEGHAASEARLVDMKMNTKQSGAQLIANFAKLWKNGWKPYTTAFKGKKVFKGIDSGCTLVLINHLKKNFDGFGKDTPGSVDIQFIYSQRIWLERIGMSADDLDENGNPVYTRVRVICRKSKLSPGGRSTIMYIDNRNGRFITDSKVIVDTAERRGIVFKKGSWYYVSPELDISQEPYNCMTSDMKWHGAAAFVEFCNDHPDVLEIILNFGKKSIKK